MKRFCAILLGLATLLPCAVHAQKVVLPPRDSQPSKPLLFSSLPDQFEVDRSDLLKLFSASVNDSIHLQLSPALQIEGRIVDKTQHNPGSLSVNARVSNYSNALLNISMRLNADNSSNIQGRILHPKYGDILQLYKEQDRYFIKKNSRGLYMPE